jgi:hypothetical protein
VLKRTGDDGNISHFIAPSPRIPKSRWRRLRPGGSYVRTAESVVNFGKYEKGRRKPKRISST